MTGVAIVAAAFIAYTAIGIGVLAVMYRRDPELANAAEEWFVFFWPIALLVWLIGRLVDLGRWLGGER